MRDSILDGLVTRVKKPQERPRWLLFVHGLGESSLCFRHLFGAPELRPYGILAPDLPGYGRSPAAEEPLGLAEFAERIQQWLTVAPGELSNTESTHEVVLIGHSMGGVIGQMVCESQVSTPACKERRSYRIAGFVNVESNLSRGDCAYSGLAVPYELDEYLERGHERVCESLLEAARNDLAHRTYSASAQICDPRAFHRNSLELVTLSEQESMARRFAALEVPTLYMLGQPDGVCTRSHELLAESHVTPRVFEPAGHWPFIDQPAAWSAALHEFLRRSLLW